MRLFAVFVVLAVLTLCGGTVVGQDFDNPDCSIETFSMSPSYAVYAQGTHVQLFGRGRCADGVRAVRFEVFGQVKAEIGAPEQSETLKTEEFTPGRGLVCFAVAGGNNSSWLAAERRCSTVTIEARSGNTSSSEANSGPGGSSNSSSGSNNSSSSSNSSAFYNGGMDVWGWCTNIGHSGANYSGDAYSWFCTNHDGSYARAIEVDAVCRFSSGGSHPYAGLRNVSDAYSWFCASSPQGRPQSQQPSGSNNSSSGSNSSNSGSGSSSGSSSSGSSGNSSTSCYMPFSEGDSVRITPGDPNNKRSGPGTGYRRTGSIPGSTAFIVTNTACSDGYGWVEVDGNGWTATGTSNDPWVERWETNSSSGSNQAEKWCSASPVDVQVFSFDWDNKNPAWQVFFDRDTNLGNLNQDEYYFYYRNEYVGPNVILLEGLNTDRNQWQAGIDTSWVLGMGTELGWPNPFDTKYRFSMKSSWRVDYKC